MPPLSRQMQYSRARAPRTALITTVGFRDVLEMRRLRIPEMYTLNYQKPDPLVPRRRRLEVVERLGPEGEVRVPLDEESVRAAAERIADGDIEAVAVSLLHAYANPAHERRVAEIVRETVGPEVFISCSSDILPVIREYERTSTTVINAYLGPALRHYLNGLRRHLEALGIAAPLQIMKSDGGVMSVEMAAERPAYLVESGPAAGAHRGRARYRRRRRDGLHQPRHGRHHGQGLDRRRRHGGQDRRLRGRRRYQPVEQIGNGRRLCAQAAGDRHLRDRRWRRLDRRHRCGRVDACRA